MKSQELRFTETNSADDSQGKTWGLDGNLFVSPVRPALVPSIGPGPRGGPVGRG